MATAIAAGTAAAATGDANCHGETTAYAAQLGKQDALLHERGVGQVARYNAMAIDDVKDYVAATCSAG